MSRYDRWRSTVWSMRSDFSGGYVRVHGNGDIGVLLHGYGELRLPRHDARMLSRRIDQALTASGQKASRAAVESPDQPEERVHNSSITAPDQCPTCHHRHDAPCTAQVGGVPGFPSTGRVCGCEGSA